MLLPCFGSVIVEIKGFFCERVETGGGTEAGVIDVDLVCWVTLFSILSFRLWLFNFSPLFKKPFYTLRGPFLKKPR